MRSASALRPTSTRPSLPTSTRLRAAVTAFFALDGFLFAGWVVRIPAVKERVGASATGLGLALLGVSAGAVATMLLAGGLCRRFGSPKVTVVTGALLSLSVVLPALVDTPLALGLVLFVFGVGYGGLNVGMNSLAVDIVDALRRPVMPSFHAAYSFGGLAGAGLGGLLAPHLSPARHLALLVPPALLVVAVAGRVLLAHPVPRPDGRPPNDAPAPHGAETARGGRGGTGLVAVFGLIALCTTYGEGALAEWGALHIEQDLHGGPGVAAAGYAAVASAMAVGRLFGTAVLERLGYTACLVAGGLLACAGMLLGALAPSLWLVLPGFALTGLGLANAFPAAIARAGTAAGPTGVAAASTLGYGGMLIGPVCIGFLADAFGLPLALTTVAALAALAAGIALAAGRAAAARERKEGSTA